MLSEYPIYHYFQKLEMEQKKEVSIYIMKITRQKLSAEYFQQ